MHLSLNLKDCAKIAYLSVSMLLAGLLFGRCETAAGAEKEAVRKPTLSLQKIMRAGNRRSACSPSLTVVDGKLYLWWVYRNESTTEINVPELLLGSSRWNGRSFAPSANSLRAAGGPPATHILEGAILGGHGDNRLFYQGEDDSVRVFPTPGEDSVSLCMTHASEWRLADDAYVFKLRRAGSSEKIPFSAAPEIWAQFPRAVVDKAPNEVTPSGQELQTTVTLTGRRDWFRNPDLWMSESGQDWWLVYDDFWSKDTATVGHEYVCITRSRDAGQHWQSIQCICPGIRGSLVGSGSQEKILFYLFPPNPALDVEHGALDDDGGHSYESGNILMRRSFDEGKTWSKAQITVPDKNISQYRVFRATDNRLWMVYVVSVVGDVERTALCLTSSKDNGLSWEKPRQITDGKYLDACPSIISFAGKIFVAFSRNGRGVNTNIWVMVIDPVQFDA